MANDGRCPVCRARIELSPDPAQREYVCQVCGTKFVLPLKRRQASSGEPPAED